MWREFIRRNVKQKCVWKFLKGDKWSRNASNISPSPTFHESKPTNDFLPPESEEKKKKKKKNIHFPKIKNKYHKKKKY